MILHSLRSILILFFFAGLFVPASAGEPAAKSPQGVTQALYHSATSDIGTDPKALEAQKKWLTLDLYSRLLKKLRQPTPKGDVPEIDGDVFLDAQEVPTKVEVGKTVETGTTADVEVTLYWSAEKRNYTVKLKRQSNVWRIDDVLYGKGRSLRDLL